MAPAAVEDDIAALSRRPSNEAEHKQHAADFLCKLSVADAKVLLERTRMEKEKKTKEMQKMIGVRYRDLIESADEIVTMHSAALRLEASLKQMPEKWRRLERTIAQTLTISPAVDATTSENPAETADTSAVRDLNDEIGFLVNVPEQMWQLLDKGESLMALQLYLQAQQLYKTSEIQQAKENYPFLASQYACIESFRPRMIAAARRFLLCRGKTSVFYASNLSTLVILGECSSATELIETFLSARTTWMAIDDQEKQDGDHKDASVSSSFQQSERHLMIMLRTILQTIRDFDEIFNCAADGANHPLVGAIEHLPDLRTQLKQLMEEGALVQIFAAWFLKQQQAVDQSASQIINQIHSIAQLSKAQTKLNAAALRHGNVHTSIWQRMLEQYPQLNAVERNAKENESSMGRCIFLLLFGDAFRKRTRDLVQNSFVDALEAIKTNIRASISDPTQATALQCVCFYEHFETIHKTTSDLDSSDLQNVLTEEFVRTLLRLVVFFEQEFSTSKGIKSPIFFLRAANICGAIVAAFPSKILTVFPGMKADQVSGLNTEALSAIAATRQVYENYAEANGLRIQSLKSALQDLPTKETSGVSFIDEEVSHLLSVGLHSFYLIAQVKRQASYPHIFSTVLQHLAQTYCEEWAKALLQQKIEPLRELWAMEPYDLTNEEWVRCHDGWSHQVITSDLNDEEEENQDPQESLGEERVWLPWSETPTVSSFLFSCCYALDEAKQSIRTASGATEMHISLMNTLIRSVLLEQVTIESVRVYEDALKQLVQAKTATHHSVLNFGECCVLQFLFDMYFVRATLGFSDFIRFGWGDAFDANEQTMPSVVKLQALFEQLQEFIDPVDWEIYGPQLIENVVLQFRKSRLLFSSLSESNDIHEINGKTISIHAQDARPIVRIAEPVARFSLLPVPSQRRRLQRAASASDHLSSSPSMKQVDDPSSSSTGGASSSLSSSLRLQNILNTSAGSNLLSAATSGGNLLSSAAKGMSYLSSATTSYLREGENRSSSKYF